MVGGGWGGGGGASRLHFSVIKSLHKEFRSWPGQHLDAYPLGHSTAVWLRFWGLAYWLKTQLFNFWASFQVVYSESFNFYFLGFWASKLVRLVWACVVLYSILFYSILCPLVN